MWKIPLFDLNFGEEEKQAVIKLIDSKWISMGEKTFEFEKFRKNWINEKKKKNCIKVSIANKSKYFKIESHI